MFFAQLCGDHGYIHVPANRMELNDNLIYAYYDDLFVEKLEAYTGIVRKPYIAHNYFDVHGNYIGCSEDFDLDTLLENAYVEVENGKINRETF